MPPVMPRNAHDAARAIRVETILRASDTRTLSRAHRSEARQRTRLGALDPVLIEARATERAHRSRDARLLVRTSVISVRGFLLLWAALTAAVVGYAILDLWLSPSLWRERHFSMQPDLTQIWEVRHWGGRLLREQAWELLLPNAVVLGGLAALIVHGIAKKFSRKNADAPERPSVVPASIPSIPPPA